MRYFLVQVKSTMVFTPVKGGTLVQMTTIICNTFVPSYASKIINNLGSFGSSEVAETATLARKHVREFIDKAKEIEKAKGTSS